MTTRRLLNLAIVFLLFSTAAFSQQRTPFDEQLRRIFEVSEYASKRFGPAKWWEEGRRFTTVEESEIIVYDTSSGRRAVLIASSMLRPAGVEKSLTIDDYDWSKDNKRLLIFTNTKRVWRDNTRGDYWVLDISTKKLRKLGGKSPESSLMFAKFSGEPAGSSRCPHPGRQCCFAK